MPQAQQVAPTQIDWGKYQEPAASAGIDFSKYAAPADSDLHVAIKQKYGLPKESDLTSGFMSDKNSKLDMDPMKFSQAYREVNESAPPQGFLSNAWGEAKDIVKGLFTSEGTGAASMPPIPGKGAYEAGRQRIEQAKTDLPGAAGRTATDIAVAALPFVPELGGKLWSKVSPAATLEESLGRKISATEADAPRAGGQIQPALNNTPREVLQHAADEGIKLTPGQATEDAMAQNLQKAGTTAAVGGKELSNALAEQKVKFGKAVNGFMDDVDPKRSGLSAESAGEQIKQTAQTAKSVAHDNASQGYQKIDYLMDAPVNPESISTAWNQLKANLPMGAEEGILAQTPRSMRAVVSDLLSGNPEGFKPTFAQSIQLRKFFRDMGDTEGLPNQSQAMFKQMSGVVDKAMESSAGENAVAWRSANAGWKDYAQKYGEPQSVLYKVLRSNDPVRTVTMLQNAPATDILTLKQEGMTAALEPLKRQVIQDIAQSRFNVSHDGIGGYSDSYLKALFSPEEVKELYLKGDLANRLKYDPNPSGTGSNISSVSQLGLWNQTKMSTAAKLSMPRDPLSFLPENVPSAPGRGSLPQPITMQQPLAATGTTGRQTSGPQRPSTLTGSPGLFKIANEMAIERIDQQIAKETNPATKARLQQKRADMAEEVQ